MHEPRFLHVKFPIGLKGAVHDGPCLDVLPRVGLKHALEKHGRVSGLARGRLLLASFLDDLLLLVLNKATTEESGRPPICDRRTRDLIEHDKYVILVRKDVGELHVRVQAVLVLLARHAAGDERRARAEHGLPVSHAPVCAVQRLQPLLRRQREPLDGLLAPSHGQLDDVLGRLTHDGLDRGLAGVHGAERAVDEVERQDHGALNLLRGGRGGGGGEGGAKTWRSISRVQRTKT